MGAGTLGRDANCRVVHQHSIEQIESILIQTRGDGFVHVARPFRKGGFEVGKGRDARPGLLVRCPKNTILCELRPSLELELQE